MAEDLGKPDPDKIPAGDQNMMQSEMERAAQDESDEFQLTPEIEVMIMEKVQDINADGVAFSHVDNEFVKDILVEGLLGGVAHNMSSEEKRKRFVESVRKRNIKIGYYRSREQKVWFNINGRSTYGKTPIRNSIWSSESSRMSIIFDISKFEELSAHAYTEWGEYEQKYLETFGKLPRKRLHTFSLQHDTRGFEGIEPFEIFNVNNKANTRGASTSSSDSGFEAPFRISPRFFTGIAIGEYNQENYIRQIVHYQLKSYKNSPKFLIPIYNDLGNLLWPQQMGYEEVKAFVAERDKNRIKNDEERIKPETEEPEGGE